MSEKQWFNVYVTNVDLTAIADGDGHVTHAGHGGAARVHLHDDSEASIHGGGHLTEITLHDSSEASIWPDSGRFSVLALDTSRADFRDVLPDPRRSTLERDATASIDFVAAPDESRPLTDGVIVRDSAPVAKDTPNRAGLLRPRRGGGSSNGPTEVVSRDIHSGSRDMQRVARH